MGAGWRLDDGRRQTLVSSTPAARIVDRFHARDLHLVMGPSRRDSRVRFRVTIDGRPPGPARGVDVDEGSNGTILEPAVISTDPPAEADCRSPVRDRVPRWRVGGVRLHVRLTPQY